MGAASIQQMADRIASLMEERMRLSGQGLEAKLARGGRRLPRNFREAGERLARAAMMAQNPRLLIQVNEEQVAEDYDLCLRHLVSFSIWHGRRGFLLRAAVSILSILVVVGALTLAVLHWRGFL